MFTSVCWAVQRIAYGFYYWFDEISVGLFTIEDLRHNIVNYQSDYLTTLGLLSRYDLIAELYENLFTRTPEVAGHDYWATGGGNVRIYRSSGARAYEWRRRARYCCPTPTKLKWRLTTQIAMGPIRKWTPVW